MSALYRIFPVLAASLSLYAADPFFFVQASDPQFGMYADDKNFIQETTNWEFVIAYTCVGGFFAMLVFASSVVSVPMCCTLMCAGGFCLYHGSGGVGRSTPPM